MSRLRWRAAAGSLLVLGLVAPAHPAGALTISVPAYSISDVFPTDGSSGTSHYNGCEAMQPCPGNAYVSGTVMWTTHARMSGITTAFDNVAYEHEHGFPGTSGTNPPYTGCWPGRYTGNHRVSLPNGYADTAFSDDESIAFSRAVGSGDSRPLADTPGYFHDYLVWLEKEWYCDDVSATRIRGQNSFRNGSCAAGLAYCVTARENFPRDVIPYRAGYRTPTWSEVQRIYYWKSNQVRNPSFEPLDNPFAAWKFAPTDTNKAAYADSPREGGRYAQFNCRDAYNQCELYYDVPFAVPTDAILTVEFAMRCRSTTSSSCPVTAALDMAGGTGERAYLTPNGATGWLLPKNVGCCGNWAFYRYRITNVNAGHTLLRLRFLNQARSNNVDLDFVTLHWTDKL